MVRLHSRHWRWIISFLLGLGTALALGFVNPLSASAISWSQLLLQGSHYIQLSTISPSQQVILGQQIDQQLHQQYKFDLNPQSNEYVNQVGQHVARISDCPQFPFHFSVVKDKQLNAFATTGGFVYVNSGLLSAADNEAELAGVVGHEIGHICNNDFIHKMQQAVLEQGLASAVGVDQNTLVKLATQLVVNLPNSRQDEFNADAKGQKYLERAGYDSHGLVNFLSKLLKMPSQPTFLSNHPGTPERISMLEQKIASGE